MRKFGLFSLLTAGPAVASVVAVLGIGTAFAQTVNIRQSHGGDGTFDQIYRKK